MASPMYGSVKMGGIRSSPGLAAHGRKTKMADSDDDIDPPSFGPVVVARAAYDAGMKLEAEVKAGAQGPAFENARGKAAACRTAGDALGAALWEEVFNFLMTRESVAAGTEIVILEPGETRDAETKKAIRPRARPPRNDRGSG
jgi:hypothetical protein